MLVHRGTLRVGDAIVAGDAWGQVRALYNYRGEKVKEATPGEPVEILGFDQPPPAGEFATVVENERAGARLRADARRAAAPRAARARSGRRGVSLETLFEQMQDGRRPGPEPRAQGRRRRARSRRPSPSSRRSSTPRCASTSSTRASAGSPRTTSSSPPPRARWSSASTCARTPRRARWPSARASRSAPTASSTS